MDEKRGKEGRQRGEMRAREGRRDSRGRRGKEAGGGRVLPARASERAERDTVPRASAELSAGRPQRPGAEGGAPGPGKKRGLPGRPPAAVPSAVLPRQHPHPTRCPPRGSAAPWGAWGVSRCHRPAEPRARPPPAMCAHLCQPSVGGHGPARREGAAREQRCPDGRVASPKSGLGLEDTGRA